MAVFCDVASYSLVKINRRFRGSYYRHHLGDDRPETSANLYETTWRNIPEDLKSHSDGVWEESGGKMDLKEEGTVQ
jgi:hypothetical protein